MSNEEDKFLRRSFTGWQYAAVRAQGESTYNLYFSAEVLEPALHMLFHIIISVHFLLHRNILIRSALFLSVESQDGVESLARRSLLKSCKVGQETSPRPPALLY